MKRQLHIAQAKSRPVAAFFKLEKPVDIPVRL